MALFNKKKNAEKIDTNPKSPCIMCEKNNKSCPSGKKQNSLIGCFLFVEKGKSLKDNKIIGYKNTAEEKVQSQNSTEIVEKRQPQKDNEIVGNKKTAEEKRYSQNNDITIDDIKHNLVSENIIDNICCPHCNSRNVVEVNERKNGGISRSVKMWRGQTMEECYCLNCKEYFLK